MKLFHTLLLATFLTLSSSTSQDLATGEIIHHHDITGLQLRDQGLLAPVAKQRAGNRAIDRERSNETYGCSAPKKSLVANN